MPARRPRSLTHESPASHSPVSAIAVIWRRKAGPSQSAIGCQHPARPRYNAAGSVRRAVMKAIIVGGGIGGLTTALMLHARGIDCEIFEQAEQVRELGVGINTLPHAIKELAEIGLLPALDRVGIRTHELFYLNRKGQEIWREPRGTDAGFEYPQFSIHRGRLQAVIYQAVRARIGESRIHAG